MQFRQLVISGLIAGAAVFLPGKVFALELPESEKQQLENTVEEESVLETTLAKNIEKSELEKIPPQDSLPVKADGSMIPGMKRNDAISTVAAKGMVERAQTAVQAAPLNKLPEQAKQATKPFQSKMANDQPPSALIKQGRDPKQTLDKAAAGEWRKPGIKVSQRKDTLNKAADLIQSKNDGPLSVNGKIISDGESEQKPAAKQFPAMSEKEQDMSREVPVNNKGSSPPTRQKYLEENMVNLSSRTKASGGPSGERTSSANISSSFYDKWFVWDHAYNLIEKHPYTARITIFRSQWVNAPPSPPPLNAPVFLA